MSSHGHLNTTYLNGHIDPTDPDLVYADEDPFGWDDFIMYEQLPDPNIDDDENSRSHIDGSLNLEYSFP